MSCLAWVRSELTLREGLSIGVQLMDVIAALHGRRIAHLDLKSENVLLPEMATIWVSDFGLAASCLAGGRVPSLRGPRRVPLETHHAFILEPVHATALVHA
jgi:serine/threonine protein kinase